MQNSMDARKEIFYRKVFGSMEKEFFLVNIGYLGTIILNNSPTSIRCCYNKTTMQRLTKLEVNQAY